MIYVFLPAYNEAVALPRLTAKLVAALRKAKQPYRIVVLNDGSSDETAAVTQELSRRFPLTLLEHAQNQGLGDTMMDGLIYCAQQASPEDCIVTMDCDDTHDPVFLEPALEKIKEGYDLVILSRFQKGGGEKGLSWPRRVLSRGACLLLKIFFPIKNVWDYSCGYRVLRASTLQNLVQRYGKKISQLTEFGFVVTPEILIRVRQSGFRIAESPFVLDYSLKPGASKNKAFRTIAGYFKLIAFYWGRPSC